jgi:dipeptidase
LIEKYGQADWGGLDYCLADPNEAWVIETTSKNWVARRVEDDEILVVANYFVIGEDFDLSSEGLLEYAEEQGWYNPEEEVFNFRKVYGLPDRINNPYDADRENRAYELLESKKGVIVPEDLFRVLMDRYEGTSKYHKPLNDIEPWEDVTDKLLIPRTINTNLCQSSTVAQLRSDLPVEIGSVMWYSMATPGYSGYFPVYAGATEIPVEYQNLNASISSSSAWWTFRLIQKYGDTNFDTIYLNLKNYWLNYHANILLRQSRIEEKAIQLFEDGKKQEANKMINSFTFSEAQNILEQARFQLRHLQEITGNIPLW